MRSLALLLVFFSTLLAAVTSNKVSMCDLRLELEDAASGRRVPGLIQVRDREGNLVELPNLLSRGFGLEAKSVTHQWSVVRDVAHLALPLGRYQVRAFSGLETEMADVTLDLRDSQATKKIALTRFFDAAKSGFRSANTHLHLKKLSREQADRYLLEVPLADGLDVVFLSYLERAIDDLEYTSNKYSRADLEHLSHHGAAFGNGEEHRHNFTAQDQGYGHVMLLNIPELIQPVSIGPGITKKGTDSPPLRVGIEQARGFGSTIIWCHNQWGLEDIPNWVMGRLHANNIFDGGTQGSFKHSFYRYLNAGLRVPFSTGTDWFMYDFSRVYVPSQKRLSAEEWLTILAAGKSWITNGPLLSLTVNGKTLGDTIELAAPGTVDVEAAALGRVDFQRIELIRDGRVVQSINREAAAGHFAASGKFTLAIDKSCWLALRTPPPPVKGDPEFQTPVPKNELGCDLFGHTSAVFVRVAGRPQFDAAVAEVLVSEMVASKKMIVERATFADDKERQRVLATYDEAIATLQTRIAESQRNAAQ